MELWLDTIDYQLIEHATNRVNVMGVTTNPSILSKSNESIASALYRILENKQDVTISKFAA